MYKKVPTDLNFAERELDILKFWNENKTFEKSIKSRSNAQVFTFYDGPPTANGKPHIGHVLTRVMKDIIPRYKTMKGYKVLRKAGWDTHGLPVELEIEKKLGINGKDAIEKFGIEEFIKECKKSVLQYESLWKKMSNRVGFWADMDNPYVTYHNSYIESVWWALKEIFDKGLLYKGHKIVPYCPRCGTSLSSHEVAQGYKNVSESSVYVKFRVTNEICMLGNDSDNIGTEEKNSDLFMLAWTTTPWTLPSNVALVVNPNLDYVITTINGERYILAEALLNNIIEENCEYKIEKKLKGKYLKGLEYEPLFDFVQVDKKAFYVVVHEFVTITEGTGIVHCAPAFGEDDAIVGKENDLPFVQLVNEEGKFCDCVTNWKGIFVKDADTDIIKNLSERNLTLKVVEHEHSYPFCWRCDTALLYYASDTWFIKMTAVRENLIKNNQKINWLPENIKDGRFGKFLENVVDWGLSRNRYWGTPLPIWECECGYIHAVGSIAELKNLGKDVPDDIELHKPYIDKVFLNCPSCKTGIMTRVKEVIDCWFDAGSMPFAQWNYHIEDKGTTNQKVFNKEIFEENFPSDFISEALDQTRGWFYTLLAISTLLFDQPAYKNVVVLGLVQDKDGQKMSKHKGNVVDPWVVLDNQGADAIRWYFYTISAPWLPSRFYPDAVNEIQRKFMGTLWNTYAFYVLYANLDKFDPTKFLLEYHHLSQMDKWILSKLCSLTSAVTSYLDNYKITESARLIQEFVDQLSNWYIRRSREIFWKSGMPQEKINAYMTLYTILSTLSKLLAPFTPFMAEEIYQNIVRRVNPNSPESIHLCDYPVADLSAPINFEYNAEISPINFFDRDLEKNMDYTLKVVMLGRSGRNAVNIKNRQPLRMLYVHSEFKPSDEFMQIIKDELNVEKIQLIDNANEFTIYELKPQLKTLGPKYGKLVPKIADILRNIDGHGMLSNLKHGSISLYVDNTKIELSEADIIINVSQKEGFISQSDNGITVVLDTTLTDDLIEKGFVREIISKIQTMRKEAGFEILDRIMVSFVNNSKLAAIIEKNKNEIMDQVLASSIKYTNIDSKSDKYTKEWIINKENLIIELIKI